MQELKFEQVKDVNGGGIVKVIIEGAKAIGRRLANPRTQTVVGLSTDLEGSTPSEPHDQQQ